MKSLLREFLWNHVLLNTIKPPLTFDAQLARGLPDSSEQAAVLVPGSPFREPRKS